MSGLIVVSKNGEMLCFPMNQRLSWDYINTGFVIINKEKHGDFMKEVQNFYLKNIDEIQRLTKVIKLEQTKLY